MYRIGSLKHLYNASTVIGGNICYFMSKYGIYEHEWYLPISIIYNKINKFVVEDFNIDNQSDAVAIRELCESRDLCDYRIFDKRNTDTLVWCIRGQRPYHIDMLCTR